jgi:hypothetical protein
MNTGTCKFQSHLKCGTYTTRKGQGNTVYHCDSGTTGIFTEKAVYIEFQSESELYIYVICCTFFSLYLML